jgi:hypothetical protein
VVTPFLDSWLIKLNFWFNLSLLDQCGVVKNRSVTRRRYDLAALLRLILPVKLVKDGHDGEESRPALSLCCHHSAPNQPSCGPCRAHVRKLEINILMYRWGVQLARSPPTCRPGKTRLLETALGPRLCLARTSEHGEPITNKRLEKS